MVIICSKTMHSQCRKKSGVEKGVSGASGPLEPLILTFHYPFFILKRRENSQQNTYKKTSTNMQPDTGMCLCGPA